MLQHESGEILQNQVSTYKSRDWLRTFYFTTKVRTGGREGRKDSKERVQAENASLHTDK